MSTFTIAALSALSIVILALTAVAFKLHSIRTSKEVTLEATKRNTEAARNSLKAFNKFIDYKSSFVFENQISKFSEIDSRISSMKSAIETLNYEIISGTAQEILRKHDMVFTDAMSQRLYNSFLNTLEEIINQ